MPVRAAAGLAATVASPRAAVLSGSAVHAASEARSSAGSTDGRTHAQGPE
jgi:hypothetical protein